jgi:hypothetical protein
MARPCLGELHPVLVLTYLRRMGLWSLLFIERKVRGQHQIDFFIMILQKYVWVKVQTYCQIDSIHKLMMIIVRYILSLVLKIDARFTILPKGGVAKPSKRVDTFAHRKSKKQFLS